MRSVSNTQHYDVSNDFQKNNSRITCRVQYAFGARKKKQVSSRPTACRPYYCRRRDSGGGGGGCDSLSNVVGARRGIGTCRRGSVVSTVAQTTCVSLPLSGKVLAITVAAVSFPSFEAKRRINSFVELEPRVTVAYLYANYIINHSHTRRCGQDSCCPARAYSSNPGAGVKNRQCNTTTTR